MIIICLENSTINYFKAFTAPLCSHIGCFRIGSITYCILDSILTIPSLLLITSNCLLMGIFDGSSGFKDPNFSSGCYGVMSFIG